MSSILTSSKLIKSIKRRGFIPESQETFQPDDFLEIATEKINIDLMANIMEARGDYLVYFEDVALVPGVQGYPIPSRAHGDKLRDAVIVDSTGKAKRELTQITMESLPDYNNDYATVTTFDPFYLQNNTLILVNESYQPDSYIRMYFYMRPNKLVLESRAATVSQVGTGIVEIDYISPKSGAITNISLTGEITSASHGLKSGNKIIISGSDSVPSIDGIRTITVTSPDTFTISDVVITTAGIYGSWNLAADVFTFPSVLFPKHFVPGMLFDVVSFKSPNKIKLYDVPANSVNSTLKTLSFRASDVVKNGTVLVDKGDYITTAEETIVPNIPTEFHPLLAQMVSVSCMESMADDQQKKSANETLAKMERDILKIVTNRVEGAPKKIKNRNGTLQATFRNKVRGY